MRYVYLITLFGVVVIVSIFGFRGSTFTNPPIDVFPAWAFPGMQYQPKLRPQAQSQFYANGSADRPLPDHVVARDDLRDDDALSRGKTGNGPTDWVKGFPAGVVVDSKLLARGQERFDIYCAVCHGKLGDGNGMTKKYGMAPANLVDDARRALSEGELFNVITVGSPNKVMMSYADKLPIGDRWAVVAYVRALQRAATGSAADVTDANARKALGLP